MNTQLSRLARMVRIGALATASMGVAASGVTIAPATASPGLGSEAGAKAPLSAAAQTCAGLKVTIKGTTRNDTLVGTSKRDVIFGGAGDDRIQGRGGNDVICGGKGTDTIIGGAGDDRIFGQRDGTYFDRAGTTINGDLLQGGAGNDRIDPGFDTRQSPNQVDFNYPDQVDYSDSSRGVMVDLSAGKSTGRGADTIVVQGLIGAVGSAHDDTITGTNLRNNIEAGGGDDVITALGGDDEVALDENKGTGNDSVDLGKGNDTGWGYSGRDELLGGDGNDSLYTYGADVDSFAGGAGNDDISHRLFTADGLKSEGGSGRDTLMIEKAVGSAWVNLDLTTGAYSHETASPVTGRIVGYESLFLYAEDAKWRVTGTDASEEIGTLSRGPLYAEMGGGDDDVSGTGRDDRLDLGAGNDTADGAGGTDTCIDVEKARSCEK